MPNSFCSILALANARERRFSAPRMTKCTEKAVFFAGLRCVVVIDALPPANRNPIVQLSVPADKSLIIGGLSRSNVLYLNDPAGWEGGVSWDEGKCPTWDAPVRRCGILEMHDEDETGERTGRGKKERIS